MRASWRSVWDHEIVTRMFVRPMRCFVWLPALALLVGQWSLQGAEIPAGRKIFRQQCVKCHER